MGHHHVVVVSTIDGWRVIERVRAGRDLASDAERKRGEPANVTATLTDASGRPLAGEYLNVFDLERPDHVRIFGPTDASGQASISLSTDWARLGWNSRSVYHAGSHKGYSGSSAQFNVWIVDNGAFHQ